MRKHYFKQAGVAALCLSMALAGCSSSAPQETTAVSETTTAAETEKADEAEVGVVQFRHCCFLCCVVRTVSDAACGVRGYVVDTGFAPARHTAPDVRSGPVGYCGNPPVVGIMELR